MTPARKRRPSSRNVFINCPFDDDYAASFQALIFVVSACGFRARCAREMDDASETRLDKLYGIIESCRYGIHDLSRTELDPTYELPRFNMPLELGLFLGAKRYGDEEQKKKRCLILDTEPYRFQKFISDLAGMDIHAHGGAPERAIAETRDWLATASKRQLPSTKRLVEHYAAFRAALPELCDLLHLDADRLLFADYERLVLGWVVEQPA